MEIVWTKTVKFLIIKEAALPACMHISLENSANAFHKWWMLTVRSIFMEFVKLVLKDTTSIFSLIVSRLVPFAKRMMRIQEHVPVATEVIS